MFIIKPIKWLLRIISLLISISILVILVNIIIITTTQNSIYSSVESTPNASFIVVLGSKINEENTLPPVLVSRLDTAVDLYKQQKAPKILVTGDGRKKDYSETKLMHTYLLQKGVHADHIIVDDQAYRTYDNVYRVKEIFNIDNIILVSQQSHLNRAQFIANNLGIKAVGSVAAYDSPTPWSTLREYLATIPAFLDVYILKPKPVTAPSVSPPKQIPQPSVSNHVIPLNFCF